MNFTSCPLVHILPPKPPCVTFTCFSWFPISPTGMCLNRVFVYVVGPVHANKCCQIQYLILFVGNGATIGGSNRTAHSKATLEQMHRQPISMLTWVTSGASCSLPGQWNAVAHIALGQLEAKVRTQMCTVCPCNGNPHVEGFKWVLYFAVCVFLTPSFGGVIQHRMPKVDHVV